MKTRPSDSPAARHQAVATPGPKTHIPSMRVTDGDGNAQDSLQRRIDHSPRMQAQRALVQAVFGQAVFGQALQQHRPGPEPVLQLKVGKSHVPQSSDVEVDTWVENGDETYKVTKLSEAGEWTKRWKLQLLKNNAQKGVIFIYLFDKVLKPDGLEVPQSEQGASYGSKLGAAAVKAMNSEALRSETADAETISLNLVNPLSAHISLKQLTIEMNGGDIQDSGAKSAGTTALTTPEPLGEVKFYDPAQFPQFWGRLVFLVKNNAMTVQCNGFRKGSAYIDASTIDGVDARHVVECMFKANVIRGFAMNINIPKPDKQTL